jgi:OPT oligopeptide transporter protein
MIQAMQKYKEAPWWWYVILLCLAFFAGRLSKSFHVRTSLSLFLGLIVVFKGQTTLPWWSYIVALFIGAFITVSYKQQRSHSYLYVICAAFLDHPFCTPGQWCWYNPIDENDSRCY